MKPILPKNRFNPFTRSLLFAVSVLLLGLLLCLGQSPVFWHHSQSAGHGQPAMNAIRSAYAAMPSPSLLALGRFSLMPRRFGVLPFTVSGEKALLAYYPTIRREKSASASKASMGLPAAASSGQTLAGRQLVLTLRHLERQAVRFGLSALNHGFSRLNHRIRYVLLLVLPAITG